MPFLFLIISTELTKINTFYSEKLAEATRKFATLKSELASAQEPSHKSEVRLVAFLTETLKQGILTKVEGSVQLTSSLW
jgi:hypothetical protein